MSGQGEIRGLENVFGGNRSVQSLSRWSADDITHALSLKTDRLGSVRCQMDSVDVHMIRSARDLIAVLSTTSIRVG